MRLTATSAATKSTICFPLILTRSLSAIFAWPVLIMLL